MSATDMLGQMVVEKMLAEEGLSRQGLGRAAFEERVWAWKRQYGDFITGQMRRLGASCDWSRERFTLDSQLSGACPTLSLHPITLTPTLMFQAWRLSNREVPTAGR